ncbi:MAG: tetrahydromethanopterin S-methyltransferase subunit F [Bacilli bacterium]|jgi:tetrahydromethanopterin S-methyltransferase subunit F|nr:tetrahydromethanopterin S-methyltransferase subunit F [Bacilli bacterium]MDY3203338.1 tetrahydromethanopterin S-methyltransferase subunit F [Methanocorpusculum sp.]
MAGSIIRMVPIDKMVDDIRYKGQILARTNKVDSAISSSGIVGFAAGVIIALVLILVPVLILLGGV